MSLHLHHPALTTTGKRKGKPKFRNAEEAKRARELAASWTDLQQRWGVTQTAAIKKKSAVPLEYSLSVPKDRSTAHIKSVGATGGIASLAAQKVYTGDKIIGVGQLHKSNAVPVFSKDDAIDIARMRR